MKKHKFLGNMNPFNRDSIRNELKENQLFKLRDKEYTQTQISEYLGIKSEDTYRKYEINPGEMRVEHLVALAKLYNVSTDYLLGLSEYKHIENEEIGNITGLSEKSIEVLRTIKNSIPPKRYDENGEEIEYINLPLKIDGKEVKYSNPNSPYLYSPGENNKILKTLDYLFSKSEIRENDKGKSIFNLLSLLYDYIFVLPDTEYRTDNDEEAFLIKAINLNNGYMEPLFTERLYKQIKKEEILDKLKEYQEENNNSFYSFNFSEFDKEVKENNKGVPFFSEENKV